MAIGTDFAGWLSRELRQRHWNKAELARRGGITDAQVSRVLNGNQRPGTVMLQAVAAALQVPLYEVYVRAGLLPAEPGRSLLIDRIVAMLELLPEEDQEELLEMTRIKVERSKRGQGGRKAERPSPRGAEVPAARLARGRRDRRGQ